MLPAASYIIQPLLSVIVSILKKTKRCNVSDNPDYVIRSRHHARRSRQAEIPAFSGARLELKESDCHFKTAGAPAAMKSASFF